MTTKQRLATAGQRLTSSAQVDLVMVLALTLSTGSVDAVSYFSLERVFTANMTGNIALIGIGLASNFSNVAGNSCAFAGFVVGSVAVARMLRARGTSAQRRRVQALAFELILLVAVTAMVAAADPTAHQLTRYFVCAILAAAMGVQTGAARHLAVQDVNTTVATMTLHDLAAASRLAGGDSVRWRRRTCVVGGLLAGAAIGVGLDHIARWAGLLFTCIAVACVIALALSRPRQAAIDTSPQP